jgi:hypothetical protein
MFRKCWYDLDRNQTRFTLLFFVRRQHSAIAKTVVTGNSLGMNPATDKLDSLGKLLNCSKLTTAHLNIHFNR